MKTPPALMYWLGIAYTCGKEGFHVSSQFRMVLRVISPMDENHAQGMIFTCGGFLHK